MYFIECSYNLSLCFNILREHSFHVWIKFLFAFVLVYWFKFDWHKVLMICLLLVLFHKVLYVNSMLTKCIMMLLKEILWKPGPKMLYFWDCLAYPSFRGALELWHLAAVHEQRHSRWHRMRDFPRPALCMLEAFCPVYWHVYWPHQ